MTREDAYYERILLLCGYWEDYDRWLNSYLETEEPLSNIVLELLDCCGDFKEIEYRRLLKPNKTETDIAYAAFIREHFPLSWSIAEKMCDKEINAMYDEWMNSVQ